MQVYAFIIVHSYKKCIDLNNYCEHSKIIIRTLKVPGIATGAHFNGLM